MSTPPKQPPNTVSEDSDATQEVVEQTVSDADGAQTEIAIAMLTVEAPSGQIEKVEATGADCILDIRQFLQDCPTTCDITCYHLEHNGIVLNDYVELAEYPQLLRSTNTQPIKIVPDFYDERTARKHVRRLRQILVRPPARLDPTLAPYVGQAEKMELLPDIKIESANDQLLFPGTVSLTLAIPPKNTTEEPKKAVYNINFSAWNPPPGNRRLRGDLLYLEVKTLEGNTLQITAGVEGFYLNKSTTATFNPMVHASSYKSRTLAALLCKASQLFKKRFKGMLTRKVKSHPFEHIDVPRRAVDWIAYQKPHSYDWNRSEDALLSTHGMDSRGVLRDWNEEYQSCRELPRKTDQDRILRDRTLYRVYSDFVQAATKGACAIINGNIPPINPMDPKRASVFIYNNVFFSLAIDGRNVFQDIGGDKVAYAIANHDINGIRAFGTADVADLHTLATCLVDYRGQRVVCQSIIPGIFHGDRASTHLYGSMDNGKTIVHKAEFHELVRKAATEMHMADHKVFDAAGQDWTLASCVDSKGISGSDGRSYMLDLMRTTPRDANFPEYSTHPTALLRHELVNVYTRSKAYEQTVAARVAANKQEAEEQKALEGATTASKDAAEVTEPLAVEAPETPTAPLETDTPAAQTATDTPAGQAATDTPAGQAAADTPSGQAVTDRQAGGEVAESNGHEVEATAAQKEQREKQTELLRKALAKHKKAQQEDSEAFTRSLHELNFNVDLLTDVKLADSEERQQQDLAALKEISACIPKTIIPNMVARFKTLEMSPVDAQSLTDMMHQEGVNVRYLGQIATLCKAHGVHHVERMCVMDMLVRSAKHLLNEALRAIKPEHCTQQQHWFLAPCISRFLSSFLGKNCGGRGMTQEQLDAALHITGVQDKREQTRAGKEREVEAKRLQRQLDREECLQKGLPRSPLLEEEEEGDVPADCAKHKKKKNNKKKKLVDRDPELYRQLEGGRSAPTHPLNPANLWQQLRRKVQQKYDYTVPEVMEFDTYQKLIMLRSLSRKVGIQVRCRDYDLSGECENPFELDDVMDLFPVTKHHFPKSKDTIALLKRGEAYLNRGDLRPAYNCLLDASSILSQVYGPMHSESARCSSLLGMVCYHAGDYAQAVEHQQRAVIVFERVEGRDHHDTAHAHSNLALFLHSIGDTPLALHHIKKALLIFETTAGPNHPDTAATHMNIGMLCCDSHRTGSGLAHLTEALKRNIVTLGNQHEQVGLSHHAVAIAFSLRAQFRQALAHEQQAKSIFAAQLGANHARVHQSVYWINQFTAGAVNKETHRAPILPQRLLRLSPLTWVSLRSSTPFKGHMTMSDMLNIFSHGPDTQQQQQQQAQLQDRQQEQQPQQPGKKNKKKKKKKKKNV